MEGPAAVCVDDPVEDDGEEEEGEGVEDLVVDVGADLEGGEAGVACEEEQQEEDSCRVCQCVLEGSRPRACLGMIVGGRVGRGASELSSSSLRTCEWESYPHLWEKGFM